MEISNPKWDNVEAMRKQFSVDQLKEECESRQIQIGTKLEMATRLIENNKNNDRKDDNNDHDEKNEQPGNTQDLLMQLIKAMESTQKSTLETLLTIASKEAKLSVTTNPDLSSIDIYTGSQNESLIEWLNQLEILRLQYRWDDATVIQAASSRQAEEAKHWHKFVGYKNKTWNEYSNAIKAVFAKPLTSRLWATNMIKRIQEPNESVSKYCYSKLSLMSRCPHDLPDECQADWILSGLQSEQLRSTMQTRYDTKKVPMDTLVSETVKTASKMLTSVNSTLERKDTLSKEHSVAKDKSDWAPKYNASKMKIEDATCFRCQKRGHIGRECPNSRLMPTSNFNRAKPTYKSKAVAYGIDNKVILKTMNPNRMVVPVKVNKIDVIGFIDPGAEVSLVRQELVTQNNWKIEDWKGGEIEALNGTILTPMGTIPEIEVNIGGYQACVNQVGVMKTLPNQFVIGNDWKKAAKVTVSSTEDNDVEIHPTPRRLASYAILKPHEGTYTKHFENEPQNSSIQLNDENAMKNKTTKELSHRVATLEMSKEVTQQQRTELFKILNSNVDAFTKNNNQIGFCPYVEHEIHLTDDIPIRMHPYRLAREDREFLKQEIIDLTKAGVVKDSTSPYASPCMVVHQPLHPSTPRRMVTDFRRLNEKTIKDPYPMADMRTTLDAIGGAKFYTKMDIKKAFYNIKIKEEHQNCTAFVTPDGHYEYIRMAFGLCNSPATMVRGLTHMKQGTLWEKNVEFYMDDIAIHTNTVEEHLFTLNELLKSVILNGYVMDFDKCEFLQEKIKFVGFIVGREGLQIDPSRTEAMHKYGQLRNVTEVRSFLGLVSHFRRFIKDFSAIAQPLIKLTKTKNAPLFTWTLECEDAMGKLKEALINSPILHHFDPNLKTIVYVDASGHALGSVLTQIDENGRERVVEYASRTLSEGDRKKHSNELEAIAAHWAIQDKFRIYLLGLPHFTVWTDNWAVAHLTTKKDLNRRFARMAMDLMEFNFEIRHRPGKQNEIADAMSRIPEPPKPLIAFIILTAQDHRLAEQQRQDQSLNSIFTLFEKTNLTELERRKKKHYVLLDNVLYRKDDGVAGHRRIVIPAQLRSTILERAHDDSGHTDAIRTIGRMHRKYWWKGIAKDTHTYVQGCNVCQRMNSRTNQNTGTLSYRAVPETPFHTISIDHEGPIRDEDKELYFICAVDHFTCYVITKPTSTRKSSGTIQFLQELGEERGWPEVILSDNDSSYMSSKTQSFFRQHGIKHLTSIARRSESNGIVERAIGKLLSILRKLLDQEPKTEWSSALRRATFLTNTTLHSGLKRSPFKALFGYDPKVHASDIALGNDDDPSETHRQSLINALENMKRRANKTSEPTDHRVGDRVWVRVETPSKFGPRYDGPFLIISRKGETLEVNDNQDKPSRIVHATQVKKYYPPFEIKHSPVSNGMEILNSSSNANNCQTESKKNDHVSTSHDENLDQRIMEKDKAPVPLDPGKARKSTRPRKKPSKLDDHELEMDNILFD